MVYKTEVVVALDLEIDQLPFLTRLADGVGAERLPHGVARQYYQAHDK